MSNYTFTSPRDGFGLALLQAARANKQVVGLCADLRESVRMDKLAKALPHQYLEVGVAEQNMLGIAAGMALSGFVPVAASFAVFNPGRNWDQLRVSICYSQANVKVIGAHAGLSVGQDGATHQSLEDLALTRSLPNLVVLAPTDAAETEQAVTAALHHKGPVYIRFGREPVADITKPGQPFVIGKAHVLRVGDQVSIAAHGAMVYPSLLAAEQLAKESISAEVIAVPTIKPLDEATLLASIAKTGRVVTAEDHQITGGLGSALAELTAEHQPVPLARIGMRDQFGESGKASELYSYYNLTPEAIAAAAKRLIFG